MGIDSILEKWESVDACKQNSTELQTTIASVRKDGQEWLSDEIKKQLEEAEVDLTRYNTQAPPMPALLPSQPHRSTSLLLICHGEQPINVG